MTTRIMPADKIRRIRNRRELTTGDVAFLLGCSPKTVSNWFDGGEFAGGWRLPASRAQKRIGKGEDRRIPRAAVIAFLEKYNMTAALEIMVGAKPTSLLACGLPRGAADRLIACAGRHPRKFGWDIKFEDDVFAIAESLTGGCPSVLVLHESLGISIVKRIVTRVRELQARQPSENPKCLIAYLYDAQMGRRETDPATLPPSVVQQEDTEELDGLLSDTAPPAVSVSGGAMPKEDRLSTVA